MRNLKLTFSYDGTDFNGWQLQPGYRTVQGELQQAIFSVIGQQVTCNASGRTDAGVHALAQVVNFYCTTHLSHATMIKALNARLPEDISAQKCEDAHQSFDANKDAKRKLYRYIILDGGIRSPFMRRYAFRSLHPLDAERMNRASKVLLGRHDFHSFETNWPNRLTSIRTITHISVNRVGEYLWLDVEADGFLYNMVRAIAGTLINIGRGFWPEERMKAIINAEDRTQAGNTAPPQGLYLVRVTY